MNLLKTITGNDNWRELWQRGNDVSAMEGYVEQLMFEFRQDDAAERKRKIARIYECLLYRPNNGDGK